MSRKNIKYKELPDREFTELTGVKKQDFKTMLHVLQEAYDRNNIFASKANPIDVEAMLLLTIEYLSGKDTIIGLSQKYNIYISYASQAIKWVVSTLGRKRLSTKLPIKRRA